MPKRAIYLDDHDRDLTRRICTFAIEQLDYAEERSGQPVDFVARRWLKKEVIELRERFEEPPEDKP